LCTRGFAINGGTLAGHRSVCVMGITVTPLVKTICAVNEQAVISVSHNGAEERHYNDEQL
jgi:hypothetical protein